LDEVPLRPGGQSFLQRLEQVLSAASAKPGAGVPTAVRPTDPASAFAHRAAALLGTRLVSCVERYPTEGDHSVLVVVVDRDAESWQPRLTALQAELFGNVDPTAPVQLEVLDRATAQALERLQAAGLIVSHVRASRHLHPPVAAAAVPLSEDERRRAQERWRQCARKLKLARI